ncbi:hypothetical protein [Nonomuraea helvata]|uniref:Uncharacterized protein n=1 Tax=Nonomuraea helvata TaxID=37484 RepID=A0ABV5S365_9ACTN
MRLWPWEEFRIGWFVTHARVCARALEVLLIPPAERRLRTSE